MGFIFLTGAWANVSGYLFMQIVWLRPFSNIPAVIYAIVSTWLYSWMYFSLIQKKKLWFIAASILLVIFAVVNLLFIQTISFANSYTYLFQSALLLIYTLSYFYHLIQDLPSLHIHQLPAFWFSAGLLFYHAGAFFLFSFTSYIYNVLNNNLITYWSFHNTLNILAHLVFFVGLYYDLKMLKAKETH
ncbi:hypothetical protein [Chryseolinea sp. H1M3-3]|uniref:hypothetical protein n=1 Tax=Chryseolinea sp. H1M3-3 TaxID=3034144 RepID=UPI0023EC333B|nr:hypothetical protein [Chryseolinea sp. H1M3-3]